MTGSQMVARSGKLGRFFGACDATKNTCAVDGLSAGFMYDIWVRTCSGSGPINCVLRAIVAQMVTYPKGMHCLNEPALKLSTFILNIKHVKYNFYATSIAS